MHGLGQLVIGIGTGRCGTLSLAMLLNMQSDAHVTHEARPVMLWYREEASNQDRLLLFESVGYIDPMVAFWSHMDRMLGRLHRYSLVGDVAFWWPPYLPDVKLLCPDVKIVGLIREDIDALIDSIVEKSGGEDGGYNHWMIHDSTIWRKSVWTAAHPKVAASSKREAIRRYCEIYNTKILSLITNCYDHLVLKTEDLGLESKQDELFDFLGIGTHVHNFTHYNAGKEQAEHLNMVSEGVDGLPTVFAQADEGIVPIDIVQRLLHPQRADVIRRQLDAR